MFKKLTLVLFFIGMNLTAQTLEGSWRLIEENGRPVKDVEVIRIYEDGYFSEGAKNSISNKFLWALGGEFSTGNYSQELDFNTIESNKIGIKEDGNMEFLEEGRRLKIQIDPKTQIWERVSENKNDLSGNWVITGRVRNSELNTMKPGDRRTIKILGGDRFQWVAFNSATKEFSGSGGGTYTAKNGIYTENITFFSRDSSRVGAVLKFDFELIEGKWHHKGNSSKGDPIHEIWSPYQEAYQKN